MCDKGGQPKNLMSTLRKPVFIFVHGIMGFDELGLPSLGLSIQYFRRVAASLQHLPIDAHFPALPAVGSVAERAQVLANYIEALKVDMVHLIAHSMGGLDCRYVASKLDPKQRIRTLTTVATPHHGSPLADWIVDGQGFVTAVLRRLLGEGIKALTSEACRRFNEQVTNRPDVNYSSYAGVRPLSEMPIWYRHFTRKADSLQGDNDGQVALTSARWGTFISLLRADHLEMVGWSLAFKKTAIQRPFDHIHFYHQLIEKLMSDNS